VSYGVDVALSCGELGTGYLVVVPLSGRVEARNGDRSIVTRPGRAGVYLPGGTTTIDLITDDCLLLAVRLERPALERELERLLDRPLRHPAELTADVDLARGPGRDWLELVQTVRPQPGRYNDLLAEPSVAERLGGTLITGLLLAASPDHARQAGRGPAPVRRALDVIEDHYPEPLTIADLATASHISVRRLQAGFRRHVGLPPMSYLRHFRLDRAHELLCRADAERLGLELRFLQSNYEGQLIDWIHETGPAFKAGESILLRDTVDAEKGRQAWQYLVGQRRTRKAPTLGYDTPDSVASGAFYFDEAFGFIRHALCKLNW